MIVITREQAQADLEKVMQQFVKIDEATKNVRAAQLVIQSIGALEKRLGHPTTIKKLYNQKASETLPQTVYDIAQRYAHGSIDETEAWKMLQEASREYRNVFQEMGISLDTSSLLF